ncbi:hypothetical protein H5410_016032 [Solanum commersonii]|uniref:Uncharacterized protein n=1 Tax=Solanum commersonii TaxID=4109 RepID=A0A9J5ZVH6_SOLCO|nr:hypothetical protein H5410_016032 [Solanum commersonii]
MMRCLGRWTDMIGELECPQISHNDRRSIFYLLQQSMVLEVPAQHCGHLQPLELNQSTIGTTSVVTTRMMCGMKNDDPKVKELDLELGL